MRAKRNLIPCATLGVVALGAGQASATVSSNAGLDISQVVGANTFYANGYTGTRATVANIEAGLVWNGHQDLTQVTTHLYDPSVTPQYDMHATWVGSAIAGRGATTTQKGIAYGATLWSGAIATNWNSSGAGQYSGSFSISTASFTTPYLTALVTGVNGTTADVVNSSWGSSGGQNGLDYDAVVLDSLINKGGKTVVVSAGNSGPTTNTIGSPASGTNALVVGALAGDQTTPVYGSVASFSSRSPTDLFVPADAGGDTGTDVAGARTRVDITAPGQNLTLAHYGGATGGNQFGGSTDTFTSAYNTNLAGTSFAAPITAAGAALVVDAGKALYAADAKAVDGRVVKAVLMNSASKPAGWNNGQTSSNGVVTTTQGLDYTYGAGILNLARAYPQYTAGTHDVAGTSGGVVQPTGWDYGTITHLTGGATAAQDYLINQPLKGGTTFTGTLDWFSNETTNADGTNPAYGSFDNLDLKVFEVNGLTSTLVAQSVSAYNSDQHLNFTLPSDGTYKVEVTETNYLWNFNGDTTTPFGLAWSSTAVPEPASLSVLFLGGVVVLGRRRRV